MCFHWYFFLFVLQGQSQQSLLPDWKKQSTLPLVQQFFNNLKKEYGDLTIKEHNKEIRELNDEYSMRLKSFILHEENCISLKILTNVGRAFATKQFNKPTKIGKHEVLQLSLASRRKQLQALDEWLDKNEGFQMHNTKPHLCNFRDMQAVLKTYLMNRLLTNER